VELKEHVAEIVSAYLRKNYVSADQLTSTIATVYGTLARLGKPDEPAVPLTPRSLFGAACGPVTLSALNVGWSGKTMRRHLTSAHRLTPGEYRTRWSLERRGHAPSQQDSTAVQGD